MEKQMFDKSVRILLVEDNAGDARIFKEALTQARISKFELVHQETLGQALIYLAKESPDVIVLDMGLPDARGMEVVQRVRATASSVPLVVLTGLNDETLAVQALHEGAQDYLIKGELTTSLLLRALRYAMERQSMHSELLSLSLIDELTGLGNRRGFLALAEHHVKRAFRTGKPFLVAFVDLDGMKQINDTFGHQEGNRALVDAANVLRDSFRQSDILARLGGDEFAILMPTCIADNTDRIIRNRFQQKLDLLNAQPDRRYKLSLSMGILTVAAEQPVSVEELLAQADALMYEEKQNKRVGRGLVRA
jgi:two-component system, cell cycle response regulator